MTLTFLAHCLRSARHVGCRQNLAQSLSKSGAELLFMAPRRGHSRRAGNRDNLNSENRAYADKIRQLNKNDVQNDSVLRFFRAVCSLRQVRYAISG